MSKSNGLITSYFILIDADSYSGVTVITPKRVTRDASQSSHSGRSLGPSDDVAENDDDQLDVGDERRDAERDADGRSCCDDRDERRIQSCCHSAATAAAVRLNCNNDSCSGFSSSCDGHHDASHDNIDINFDSSGDNSIKTGS